MFIASKQHRETHTKAVKQQKIYN